MTLNAPGGSKSEAASAVKAGNQAFAAGQWSVAKQQYEKAIGVQKTLAEAHYNLALTLDRMGQRKQAEGHYTQAANFAPGHQVIWNSRIYRRYGDVTPSGGGSGAIPGAPGLGGLGGLGGIGGGGRPGGAPPGGF
ncbi:MAG: tetratricopeptide repeat protein [Nitrospira sp.]|nr:tetratricopeptide repeat protein [Nitrospira sp.]MCY4132185.1 tetratricopeptide repeat protein [Nitrospira sp.]